MIGADLIVLAQPDEMADRQFVHAVFIPRIDLLRRAQHLRQRGLLDVPVLPHLAQDLPIIFHRFRPFFNADRPSVNYFYAKYSVSSINCISIMV